MPIVPAMTKKRLAVVGAGPAGLAFAVNAASRGHSVTLFDAAAEIGGQFTIARQIPGKEEFYETLRYYRRMIELTGVDLRLNQFVTASDLAEFDETILSTGIAPRTPEIEGVDHPKVLSYLDVLRDKMPVGEKVAIIGCGGIGFDTAMYLSQPGEATSQNIAEFCVEWGIDTSLNQAGGLRPEGPQLPKSPRQIVMLQRKASKPGDGLGKTTGWIHRATLLSRGVKMIPAVSYQKIDDEGLHVLIGGEPQLLRVDNVILCAGQEPRRELAEPLLRAGKTVHLIGGCDVAMELDARRAIAQGTRLALEI
jgi:2,4-dienoyl-CoA reductase (NADPH2)